MVPKKKIKKTARKASPKPARKPLKKGVKSSRKKSPRASDAEDFIDLIEMVDGGLISETMARHDLPSSIDPQLFDAVFKRFRQMKQVLGDNPGAAVSDLDVTKVIKLHLITSPGPQFGWMHTHGMNELNLPDLEMRNVPLFLGTSAARFLNQIAQYMYNAKKGIQGYIPVEVGHTFVFGENARVLFEKSLPMPGDEMRDVERWTVTDMPMRGACDHEEEPPKSDDDE